MKLYSFFFFFFFKKKTPYEVKECDWSSDVCSSDLTVALKIAEQAALMFVSTPPPLPLDRHALPALTVFESTIVPVANVLPAFVVSAENVANVPEPDAIDTRPITVRSIKYCLTRFLDMVAPSWGNGVIEATRARAGLSSFVSHSRRKSLERLRTSLVVLAVWIVNA